MCLSMCVNLYGVIATCEVNFVFLPGIYTVVVIVMLRIWRGVLQKVVAWNTIFLFLTSLVKLVSWIVISQYFPQRDKEGGDKVNM